MEAIFSLEFLFCNKSTDNMTILIHMQRKKPITVQYKNLQYKE